MSRIFLALTTGCCLCAVAAMANAAAPDGRGAVLEPAAASSITTAALGSELDAELIFLLEREGSRQLSAHLQEQGRLRHVDIRISIDIVNAALIIDFGEGFLPGPDEGYAEMFPYSLGPTLRHYVEQAGIPINEMRFLFQGRPIQYYFPEDQAVPAPAMPDSRRQ